LSAAQALQACETVPITGRSQLRLISSEEEAKVGVQAFQQLRQQETQKGRLLTEKEDPAAHAWVKRVSDRVIWASGLGNTYHWDYMIINDPKTINAAAIAGGELAMAAVGLGGQVGVLLPYSRAQESEADHVGLLLMAKAGYDPHESVALWHRMEQAGGGSGPEFLSTHPNSGTRIANLEGWIPQALPYYQNRDLPLPGAQ